MATPIVEYCQLLYYVRCMPSAANHVALLYCLSIHISVVSYTAFMKRIKRGWMPCIGIAACIGPFALLAIILLLCFAQQQASLLIETVSCSVWRSEIDIVLLSFMLPCPVTGYIYVILYTRTIDIVLLIEGFYA